MENSKKSRFIYDNIKKYLKKLTSTSSKNQIKKLTDLITKLNQDKHIDKNSSNMVLKIINMKKLNAFDTMIPYSKIAFFYPSHSLKHVIETIQNYGFSRYPIIDEKNSDSILGIILSKDLIFILADYIKNKKDDNILDLCLQDIFNKYSNILRKAMIIPENKSVLAQLSYFQTQKAHLSLVVNEFGQISGLLTLEDIIEAIVGKINDEYDIDIETENIKKLNSGGIIVEALVPLEEAEQLMNTSLSTDQDIDTFGGWVIYKFGRLPKKNEVLNYQGWKITTLEVQSRRIKKLYLKKLDN